MSPAEEKPKSKRPANTAFKQQRLKAWQPILTPKTVLPTFFIVGLIFIPVGIGLFIASEKVNQIVFDYTNCYETSNNFSTPDSSLGPIDQWKWDAANRKCTIQFSLSDTFQPPVFLYYRLTNFYQNHRRYVKSFDQKQLAGTYYTDGASLTSNCDPIRTPTASTLPTSFTQQYSEKAQYYPCGLIANSMFSDHLGGSPLEETSVVRCVRNDTSMYSDAASAANCSSGNIVYQFTENGIAWPSDGSKFKQSGWVTNNPDGIPTNLIPPPEWITSFEQFKNGFNTSNLPDIGNWQRFQVWMRTAGLPNFRKLWGVNKGVPMWKGVWELEIIDNFNVTRFGGTKSVVISTVSVLGGKNPFLGVAYMAVGGICWVLGIIFLVRQMIKPRKLGDHTYLSWNQPQGGQRNGASGGAENLSGGMADNGGNLRSRGGGGGSNGGAY